MKQFSHPWSRNKQCFEFVILNELNAKYTRNIREIYALLKYVKYMKSLSASNEELILHYFAKWRDVNMLGGVRLSLSLQIFLFSNWIFLHKHSRFTGEQGKEEAISVTPLYPFQPLQRNLNTSRVITAENSLCTQLALELELGTFGFRPQIANH